MVCTFSHRLTNTGYQHFTIFLCQFVMRSGVWPCFVSSLLLMRLIGYLDFFFSDLLRLQERVGQDSSRWLLTQNSGVRVGTLGVQLKEGPGNRTPWTTGQWCSELCLPRTFSMHAHMGTCISKRHKAHCIVVSWPTSQHLVKANASWLRSDIRSLHSTDTSGPLVSDSLSTNNWNPGAQHEMQGHVKPAGVITHWLLKDD